MTSGSLSRHPMQLDAVFSLPVLNIDSERTDGLVHGTHPRAWRGPVTREMAQARARELALIAGRPAPLVLQSDYEQAKRELTGEWDFERQNAVFDAADPGSNALARAIT